MKRFLKTHRLTIWIVVFTAATVYALVDGDQRRSDLSEANEREEKEEVVEAAQQCVTAYTVRETIRDAIELGVRGGAHASTEALVEVASGGDDPADPATIEKFRQAVNVRVADDIARSRKAIPDPECDQAESREIIEGGIGAVELP